MEMWQKIMRVASIRNAIDSSFSDVDIHNGIYFDVMEKIDLPSEDGNYSEYDAIAIVTKRQAEFMKTILDENKVAVAYICI